MALDPAVVGRSWPPRDYAVGREKVREFARAVGAADPVHRDPDAARAVGHADVVAPPTFAVVFTWEATKEAVDDPGLGLDFARVVHRDQSFAWTRPVVAGDVLTTTVRVDGVRELAGNDVVTFAAVVTDEGGADVLTATTTLVARREEADR